MRKANTVDEWLVARFENGERQLADGSYIELADDKDIDAFFDILEMMPPKQHLAQRGNQ